MTGAKQDAALEDVMEGGVIDAFEHKVLRRELVAVRRRHAIHARTMWRKQKKGPRDLLPFHPLFADKHPVFKELTSQPVINQSLAIEIFLSCDGRTSACHRIPPVAAGEDDPKGKSRRQGRQSRTSHFLHSVPTLSINVLLRTRDLRWNWLGHILRMDKRRTVR